MSRSDEAKRYVAISSSGETQDMGRLDAFMALVDQQATAILEIGYQQRDGHYVVVVTKHTLKSEVL